MIEVNIDSIRVSLLSQNRIVVLKEENSERFLPIWIGPFEADAITLQLQGMEAPRPLTHDLLRSVIETLGGEVIHIMISSLERNTYFARIVLDVNGDTVEVDSRPSDAIALAVRVQATCPDALKDQRAALLAGTANPRDDLKALVAGPQFDRARALALVEGKTGALRDKAPAVVTALADFYDSLKPEQQQQLREMLAKGRRHRGGHPRRDAARDGRLRRLPADPPGPGRLARCAGADAHRPR